MNTMLFIKCLLIELDNFYINYINVLNDKSNLYSTDFFRVVLPKFKRIYQNFSKFTGIPYFFTQIFAKNFNLNFNLFQLIYIYYICKITGIPTK
ncbi:hypothetical protein BpHYR1_038430 [Brachionus plicatilis]|uniref:Uncharacterized protein n=1 Tax=Brachionus plicatilis TaxID=10195 RepID=A0A3M7Q071_BRAPC|nr:hypothetical protein BpHYR1_038430 [Brachionus plicatilis]